MLGKALQTAAAGSAAGESVLGVEDVFSTYLYTGNGSTQTITNGIDLAGEGGIVWGKQRSAPSNHWLMDASAGGYLVSPNQTRARDSGWGIYPTSSGFSFNFGGNFTTYAYNQSGVSEVAWTFRKAEKFFDVVTYTGTGANRTIAHNLGSVPGCIIVKRTDTSGDWQVYHRANTANPETDYLVLNSTATTADSNTRWNDTAPTSSEFTVGTEATVNASGGTYVAYLFAHDAGGFGDDESESVIKCGSYSGSSEVDLGWEPQWVLIKPATNSSDWYVFDNMRGWFAVSGVKALSPNTSSAEGNGGNFTLTSTGFKDNWLGYSNTIYIAIRRGPMKTPTDATTVFAIDSATSTLPAFTSNFTVDATLHSTVDTVGSKFMASRLTGTALLKTEATDAEISSSSRTWDYNNGCFKSLGTDPDYLGWMFRRAPGFFDVVAYTGTGSARTVAHNLGVAPELMFVKRRGSTGQWRVYSAVFGGTHVSLLNNTTNFYASSGYWNNTNATSSVFTVGTQNDTNASSGTFIAYLFATCPGVSKVGSYTGTGTTLQIDCGFASGARFVLIKRTDSTGDWYVWDTARGIVSGNDPYLLLNSTAAEVTSTDYIDPYAAGFEISSTAPAAINASGGSYIFLAIA